MKWPAIVRFDNSDELDAIEDEISWQAHANCLDGSCQLISSDGTVYSVVTDSSGCTLKDSNTKISAETAVKLARRHMAAQSHCSVAKFNASSVEAAIAAILLLEQD